MDQQSTDMSGEVVKHDTRTRLADRRAFLAFWTSFIGFIPIVILVGLVQNFRYESRDLFALIMVLISGLVWLVGLILDVIAIVYRGERQPTRSSRAITAVVINAILLLISVLVVFGIIKMLTEAKREIQMAADKEAAEVRAKVGEGDKYEAVLAYRIFEDFNSIVNEAKANYVKSSVTFTNASLLDMSAVKSIDDIRYKEDVVRDYLKASKNLKQFSLEMVALLKKEISKHHVSSKTRDELLKPSEEAVSKMNPVIIEIRNADIHRAETLLELVSLFEKSWGQWNYNTNKQAIEFLNPTLERKYKAVLAQKDQAEADLLALKAKQLRQNAH